MVTPLQPNPAPPVISLLTDFGQKDGYVGAMQGVILTICPTATLVTLSHQVPPQDVRAAAFILYQACSYYPPHTVHCVVVDPGVGSSRRAVAVRTSHGIFIGPDNGVFSLALAAPNINVVEAVTLTNPDYRLPQISATFHGRDIFAPAAAHVAGGAPLHRLGPRAINLVKLDLVTGPEAGEPVRQSRIIHIDHFGNAILDITADQIRDPRRVSFTIGNAVIEPLSRTFADVEEGQLLAYPGSSRDHVEIAVRNGSAARRLGLKVGDVIEIIEKVEL